MMTAIQHVQISVEPEHLDAAIEFYAIVLGGERVPNPWNRPDLTWIRNGQAEVHIRVEKGIDRHKTKAHVAYVVDDLSGVREKLIARKVKIEEQPTIPGFNRIHTFDPSGNRVEVMEKE